MNEPFIKRFIFENRYRFLRHFCFWMTIFIVMPVLYLSQAVTLKNSYTITAIMLPGTMIYTYVLIDLLVPKFLIKERYGWFLLTFFVWAVIGMLLDFFWRFYFLLPWREHRPPPALHLHNFFPQVFTLFSFVVCNTEAMFAVFIRIFKYWYFRQRQALQLTAEKLSAELQLLKTQLHPHFLFNSLNSLYALVLARSDKAPEFLLKISGLLSYMLYECNTTQVSLEKEVSMLMDYIALQKEGYGDRLEVSLNISGDIPGSSIAPLLMLPLTENAFKHGASEQLNKAWISFDLSVKDGVLQLNLVNSKNDNTGSPDHSGIGIDNLRKQLELIYEGRHELLIGDEGDLFYVALTITLDYIATHEN